MKTSYRRTLLAALLAGVIIIAYLAIHRRAVLFSLKEIGDSHGEPFWALFNPLRDRSSENVAIEFLSRLSEGRYDEAAELLDSRSYLLPKLEAEQRCPIRSWELVSRKDSPDSVRLYFSTIRFCVEYTKEVEAPAWITLGQGKSSPETWRILRYEVWY